VFNKKRIKNFALPSRSGEIRNIDPVQILIQTTSVIHLSTDIDSTGEMKSELHRVRLRYGIFRLVRYLRTTFKDLTRLLLTSSGLSDVTEKSFQVFCCHF